MGAKADEAGLRSYPELIWEIPVYSVFLIHVADDARASRVRDSISEEARKIDSVIEFPQRDEISSVTDTSAIAVYLGSTRAKTDQGCHKRVHTAIALGLPIIPVIEAGDTHSLQVPGELEYVKALTWPSGDAVPTQLVGAILEALGINEKERRVFISYRQSDARDVADYLYHALLGRRFQVFLDRLQTTYGENIQERISEALEDMAFVLLLYSPEMPNSEWVQREITQALKSQLPILVIRWTTATQEVSKIKENDLPTIMFDPRVDYRGDAIRPQKLQEILDNVERWHSDGLRRRRRESMTAARLLAEAAGWVVAEEPRWKLVLTRTHGGPPPVLLGVTPRLARAQDLYELDCWETPHLGVLGITWRKLLMQSSPELPVERSNFLEWVRDGRNFQIVLGASRLAYVL